MKYLKAIALMTMTGCVPLDESATKLIEIEGMFPSGKGYVVAPIGSWSILSSSYVGNRLLLDRLNIDSSAFGEVFSLLGTKNSISCKDGSTYNFELRDVKNVSAYPALNSFNVYIRTPKISFKFISSQRDGHICTGSTEYDEWTKN